MGELSFRCMGRALVKKTYFRGEVIKGEEVFWKKHEGGAPELNAIRGEYQTTQTMRNGRKRGRRVLSEVEKRTDEKGEGKGTQQK